MTDVGLHFRRRVEAVLVDCIEELLDPAGAEILLPVLAESGLMVVGNVGVVGVEREPDRRVVQLGQLIERDHADPVEGARGAVDRGEAVAGLAQRHEAGVKKPMSPVTSA